MGDAGHDAEIVGDQQQAEPEVALELGQQTQDLRLHRDIERGGRLVGDQELRLAHQRHGDHHALAQAARELVRELAEAKARCGDADAAQKVGRAIDGDPLAHLLVAAHHLGHLRADRVGRIEAGHRLLEDHRHGIAAQPRHAAIVELQKIVALEAEAFGRAMTAARQQVHDGERGHRLAAARFAHQAMGLAALDRDRGAAHCRGTTAEAHFELFDFEQRAHVRDRVPKASRSPSPSRLMPRTSTNNATPGITITHGLKNM